MLTIQIGLMAFASLSESEPAASPITALRLIQPEEAALGPYQMRGTESSSRGPRIVVSSPHMNEVYDRAFPLRVSFLQGKKGYEINMDSLRLIYQRGWGIDITSRVTDYVKDLEIFVPNVSLPSGHHSVEIYIEDVRRNASRQVFSVDVMEHD